MCIGLGLPAAILLVEDAGLDELRRHYLNQRVHVQGELSSRGTLAVDRINDESVTLRLYLSREREDELPSGGGPLKIRAVGTVEWPHFSEGFADYLRRQGYVGQLSVDHWHGIRVVEETGRPLAMIREHVSLTFREWRSRWPVSVDFLRALVLGDKHALDDRILNLLHGLGLSHLFVISGLHVGILFYVVVSLTGTPRTYAHAVFYLALLAVYLSFLGWPVPATRAGLMAGIWVVAEVLQRRSAVMGSFLTTVSLLLTYDPALLFDVGFQLSAAAMLGIFAVMPYSERFRGIPGLPFLVINIGAFLGVMPVLMYQFGMIPRWGYVMGYVGGLVFPLFLLLLGLQIVLMGSGLSLLADWGEYGFQQLLEFSEGMLHLFSPGVYTVESIPGVLVVLFGLSLWCMLDRNLGPFMQGIGLAVAVVMLVPVIFVGPTSSLAVSQASTTPFVAVQLEDPVETLLIVPPYRQPDSFEVNRMEWHLRNRGVYVVDRVYSDLPEGYWRERGWTLPTGRFVPNWEDPGRFRRTNLTWVPEDRRLEFGDWVLRLAEQPPVGPTAPPGLLGRTNRGTWLVESPGQLDEALYAWLREEKNYVNLEETSLWIYSDGFETTDPPPESGYIQRSLRLLGSLTR